MSDNEKLIAKARAAIKPTDSIELVRAFEHLASEKAHTPTDDESIEWRPVVGYEGIYEVSEAGDVRSIERTEQGENR